MVKRLPQPWNLNTSLQAFLRKLLTVGFGMVLVLQLWGLGTPTAGATGVYSMPNLTASEPVWVFDQATALSRATRNEISGEFGKLAQQTGTEVRFVTVHRLDYGVTIEDFTQQLFQKWFPTPEAQVNQVLLVLDNVTNTTAIQSGAEAKALLSDEIATSVAQETVMVPLRAGNKYNQAFLEASDRLMAVLSGEVDPGPPVVEEKIQTEGTFTTAEETNDRSATVIVVVLLVLATVIPMATYFFFYQGMSS